MYSSYTVLGKPVKLSLFGVGRLMLNQRLRTGYLTADFCRARGFPNLTVRPSPVLLETRLDTWSFDSRKKIRVVMRFVFQKSFDRQDE
jgi:hypothetical protein